MQGGANMKKSLAVILICVAFVVGGVAGAFVGYFIGDFDDRYENRYLPTPSNDNVTTVIPEKSDFIGEEKAKEIALENAGIQATDVKFVRCNLDFDDGIWKYDIEFHHGKTEYDAEIKADDGYVISFETDYND